MRSSSSSYGLVVTPETEREGMGGGVGVGGVEGVNHGETNQRLCYLDLKCAICG